MIDTVDPRTGTRTPTTIRETTQAELATIAASSTHAFRADRHRDRNWRSQLLRTIADALDTNTSQLVDVALRETGLSKERLTGEVARSSAQFRMFAAAVAEGSFLEAIIDHAEDGPAGRLPDIRRMLVPIGPIAVFGSSNFPFAFSVAGGDTASAIAAGNPVVVKAHDSHPLTSQLSFEVIRDAALSHDANPSLIQIVHGKAAGAELVAHPAIKAVGFTGSSVTADILINIINQRSEPIPFFGELSSLNPFILTTDAIQQRGEQIAAGLTQSITASGGQLCTKPGLAFVPSTADAFLAILTASIEAHHPTILLNERIFTSFHNIAARLTDAGADVLATGTSGAGNTQGFAVSPTLLVVPAERFTSKLAEEAFGPLLVVVTYGSTDQLLNALTHVPNSLTATIHSEANEASFRATVVAAVEDHVGRIVFNGYPTGVRVSWAQHHGGPWPATNTQHTSVGVTAVRRFLRPLAWQDAPEDALPAELRDNSTLPRRVNTTPTFGPPEL